MIKAANSNYPSNKWSLWPCFWLQSNACSPTQFYNEVDIAESSALTSFMGNHILNNNYVTADTCDNKETHTKIQEEITLAVGSLNAAFHKYALQWDSHRLVYYFDDVPITIINDPSGISIPQNAMTLFLNFCVEPWHAYLPADWIGVKPYLYPLGQWPASWPQFYKIDYVRYYKLASNCSLSKSICLNSDFVRDVRKDISIGGGSCTPTFNQTTAASSYTLRATDFVLIDVGTVINPSGTGYMAIDIIGCPQ